MILAGVDADTTKLVVCLLSGEPPAAPTDVNWLTAVLRDARGTFVHACQAAPSALALALAGIRIDEAYVERAWGNERRSDFPLGAIFGATTIALANVSPGCHVEEMPAHQWKKTVTAAVGLTTKKGDPGLGNAPKPVANEACRRILRDHNVDSVGLTPDQLDAFGIAYAGWTAGR